MGIKLRAEAGCRRFIAWARCGPSGVSAQRPFVPIPSWSAAILTAVEAPLAGRDYPGRLREFNAWFVDDEACLRYLAALRWPSGFVCPGCSGGRAWRTERVETFAARAAASMFL